MVGDDESDEDEERKGGDEHWKQLELANVRQGQPVDLMNDDTHTQQQQQKQATKNQYSDLPPAIEEPSV